MKKLALLVISSYILNSNAQNIVKWTAAFGGSGSDYAYDICTDIDRNIYTIGYFYGNVDFDPGITSNILSAKGAFDIFIQKLDSNGNLVWVKKMGGPGAEAGTTIYTDQNGNIYAAGSFEGKADFDPSAGIFNLTANGKEDVYVQKLDSKGNFIWARQMGGAANDVATSIHADNDGNIYVLGWYYGAIDFDPDTSVFNVPSNGMYDVFLQKLDSSGQLIWVKHMGGKEGDQGTGMCFDQAGNIYITGHFKGVADFAPGVTTHNLTSAGESDIFVQKFDKNGNFLWVKQVGGTLTDKSTAICYDSTGSLLLTGYFEGTADFDPSSSSNTLVSSGATKDIFILKLDTAGNYIWSKRIGGMADDIGKSICNDSMGNVYVIGDFEANVDFDPGQDVYELISNGDDDICMLKLDSSGSFVWAGHMGSDKRDVAASIYMDNNRDVLTAARFQSTISFDPTNSANIFTSNGSSDILLQKLDPSEMFVTKPSFTNTLDKPHFVVYPNPIVDYINIKFNQEQPHFIINISNMLGQLIGRQEFVNTDELELDLSGLKAGIHWLNIIDDKGYGSTLKVVKE